MNDKQWIDKRIQENIKSLVWESLNDLLIKAKKEILNVRNSNNKIILAGNGASTTIASHGALDIMNQLGVKCYCANDPNQIMAFSNDFGYEKSIERYIRLTGDENDLVILISSSGESKNILNAVKASKEKKIKVITFSGFKSSNSLRKIGDINFWVDSKNYNIVEAVHNTWLVTLCDLIVKDEQEFIGNHGRNLMPLTII